MNYKKPDKDVILQYIRAKQGNKSDIARTLGVDRGTVYKWINEDEELKKAIEDANEAGLDFAESQLMLVIRGIPKTKKTQDGKEELVGWIEKPDVGAIKFLLATKGKKRGYSEKLDVEHSGGINITWIEELTKENETN